MVAADDCEMERVLVEKLRGPETTAEVTCPMPFPVKRPPNVVDPVPPKLVVSVVEPMTEPFALAKRKEEAMEEMARLVEVACEVVALPRTVRLEPKETAPETESVELMVVEPVKYELPVVVAPPETVRPPVWVPEPSVVEARKRFPPEKVLESPRRVEEAKVQVEVEKE